MKKKHILLISIFVLFAPLLAYASKPVVNVLTWWGYLDNPVAINMINKKCGTAVSYDDYTSNDDMQRRWKLNQDKYDVIIFSDTIYNAIKDKIANNNSNLWKNSINYNPVIKKRYLSRNYPHNIAYFIHSLTLFIWNPNVIYISPNDNVQEIFYKAKRNKVILLDDPVEINMLLGSATEAHLKNFKNSISLLNLKKLTSTSKVFISNEINNIYQQKDFAFSYEWSGDAISKKLNDGIEYNYTINTHLSYISTDLVAQVQQGSASACVANVIASKEFLAIIQNKSRYFSPYGDIGSVTDNKFKDLYKTFLINLSQLKWLEPPSSEQLKKLNNEWNDLKYELTQSRD